MTRVDSFIASCSSWEVFYQRLKEQSRNEQGRVFERFVQLYLETQPAYRLLLSNVWLGRDVPVDVRKAINLPSRDEGIDLIARTKRGKYWAIQAKFYDENETLTRRRLSTFVACAANTCRDISLLVVAHASLNPIGKRDLYRDTQEMSFDRWMTTDWSLIVRKLKGKNFRPRPRTPKPHQTLAIKRAKEHFMRDKSARGRMLMPCGTGKSLAALWIADALNAKTIVVAVPNLGLIRQGVEDWSKEFVARGQTPDWICVCSDDQLESDEFVGKIGDLAMDVDTDPEEIALLLRRRSKLKIVFTTYQSSEQLAEAARRARIKFDLVVLDEAHRTVGAQNRSFAALLSDKFKARYRLFMTATERRVNGDFDNVYSMDDNEEVYGKRFYTMSFAEAIKRKIICDYKILTLAISDKEIKALIASNRLLNLNSNLTEAEARTVATGIALKRAYKKYKITHPISFHTSIFAADTFRQQQDVLNSMKPTAENFHVSSKVTPGKRAQMLAAFAKAPRALMTNARCLTEGVDVPNVDCVAFADPKQSVIDIIQASGRALRTDKNNRAKLGYLIVPVVVPEDLEFEDFAATTAFKTVARIITALSVVDERIVEELRAIQYGRVSKGKKIIISTGLPVGKQMALEAFAKNVSLKLWENVGRLNWRPFEEAREFVRKLDLASVSEWKAYCKSDKRQSDIPVKPDRKYSADWISWPDWFGTKPLRPNGGWRPFEEARAFVRKLDLKDGNQWKAYCQSSKRPDDIPVKPNRKYADWISLSDWLGNGRRMGGWRPFKQARAFVRKLNLKDGNQWKAYCQSSKRPVDIPQNPSGRYRADWISMSDWLGTRPNGGWRPFKEARAFVRKLGLKNTAEWFAYCQSDKKPDNIPVVPKQMYNADWICWSDWIGCGQRKGGWRSFKQARAFVRKLGLAGQAEWCAYSKSNKKPNDIPAAPQSVYRADWINLSDWLGTKPPRPANGWRPFKKARAFVRKLGLASENQWIAYAQSNKKPDDIPRNAYGVYRADWINLSDWLGTKPPRPANGWRPFKKARAFVRKLGLASENQWIAYAQSNKKPDDIPTNAYRVYRADWTSMSDWLGSSRRVGGWRPFEKARAFVRKLGLASEAEWYAYAHSKKPDDIPITPWSTYRADWIGMSDWLGTKPPRPANGWRPFKKARKFVRDLGFANRAEWQVYCKSDKKPADIPDTPWIVYADWISLFDWLGRGRRIGNVQRARLFANPA